MNFYRKLRKLVAAILFMMLVCFFSFFSISVRRSYANNEALNGVNVFTNGDFEYVEYAGEENERENPKYCWNFDNSTATNGYAQIVSGDENVYEGKYAVKFTASGKPLDGAANAPYIQQNNIKVKNNSIYLMEFYVFAEDVSADFSFSTFCSGSGLKWKDNFSPAVKKATDGWQKVKSLLTFSEQDPVDENGDITIYIGFKAYAGTGTVSVDGITLKRVFTTSEAGYNFDFEYGYEGEMPYNWQLGGTAGGSFVMQNEELRPGAAEGSHAAKVSIGDSAASTILYSEFVDVEGGEIYNFEYWVKAVGGYDIDCYPMFIQYDKDGNQAYGVIYDGRNSANYYQSRGSFEGAQYVNPLWVYHIYGTSEWRKAGFSFKVADSAARIQLRLISRGKNSEFFYDDVKIEKAAGVLNEIGEYVYERNEDFEIIDEDGYPVNWFLSGSRSYNSVLQADETVYHSGKQSAHIVSHSTLEKTVFESSARIPVKAGINYELSLWYNSRNCSPTSIIKLDLYTYDKNGNNMYDEFGNKLVITGTRAMLNAGGDLDEWKRTVLRTVIQPGVEFVSYSLTIAQGKTELWLDDITMKVVEDGEHIIVNDNDFHAVDHNGFLSDFTLVKENGEASFIGYKENGESFGKLAVEDGSSARVATDYYALMQDYAYSVRGKYTATEAAEVKIRFYDAFGAELSSSALSFMLAKEDTEFSLDFVAPSNSRTELSIGFADGGEITLSGITLYQTALPKSKASWDGQWIWYNENPTKEAVKEYRYFRYTFNLDRKAIYAPLQLTVDDKYQIYVNGIYLDSNWEAGEDSWGNVQKYFLEDYLKEGKNVIAIKAYNLVSEAGVLFDGKFTLENQSTAVIVSDNTVKVTKTPGADVQNGDTVTIPKWATLDFDDSEWNGAKTFGKPPCSPWGTVYYDSSLYVTNKIKITSVEEGKKVETGETLVFKMTVTPLTKIDSAFSFRCKVLRRNTDIEITKASLKIIEGEADVTKWEEGKSYTITLSYRVPSYLEAGRYDLQLSDPTLMAEGDVYDNKITYFRAVAGNNQTSELVAEVRDYNGTPTIMINDEPYSPVFYLRPDFDAYLNNDDEEYISQSTFQLYITYQGGLGKTGTGIIWESENVINYDVFDSYILDMLAVDGDALVMVNVGMFPPAWWCKKNPGQKNVSQKIYKDADGVWQNGEYVENDGISFASEKWMTESGEVLRKLMQYMVKQPYYNRIFGVRITAGSTYEFMTYGSGSTMMPDYSDAARAAFKVWAKEKYKTIEALQKAWGDTSVTDWSEVEIPSMVERMDTDYRVSAAKTGTIYNSGKERRKIDYNLFLNSKAADCLLYWANIVKTETQRKKIVGAYNGYLTAFGSYDGSAKAHTAIDRVFSSADIDFIASPIIYGERMFGDSTAFMAMADSAQAYGKLYILEQDNRTFLTNKGYTGFNWNASWDYSVGETHVAQDTVYQFKRDFSHDFVNGAGLWHYNMYGGWLNDAQLYQTMAKEKSIYDNSLKLENRSFLNEVAVFVADEMYAYSTVDAGFNSSYTLYNSLLVQQRRHLAKMGVGYDMYAMSSLKSGKVAPHKLNIFLSPFEVTPETREAINKYIKKDGQYAVWIYLPGISDGYSSNAENIKALTGFEVVLETRQAWLQVEIAGGDNALTSGINGLIYGNANTSCCPVTYINDADATILGYMKDNGKPGLGVKKFNDWTSVYSSAVNLDVDLLRNLCKAAGVHIYSESNNDVIYSNANYVALHSAVGGKKTIKLDGTYAVYDEFAGKYVSYGTDTIEFTHVSNDTVLFRLEKPFTPSPEPGDDKNESSIVVPLCIAGGAVCVVGIGVGIWIWLVKRKKRIDK